MTIIPSAQPETLGLRGREAEEGRDGRAAGVLLPRPVHLRAAGVPVAVETEQHRRPRLQLRRPAAAHPAQDQAAAATAAAVD